MISEELLAKLRNERHDGVPVVSVYLRIGPDVSELRALTPRLKDLLHPIREAAADLDRDSQLSVRTDVDRITNLDGPLASGRGTGVAVFASHAAGLYEVVPLPAAVRDRAVLDDAPYLWPLEAMAAELRRYCGVVLDRRRAEILRFHQRELESWEQINAEELRKANYGGFSGYEERRVRTHAEEVATRHYRDVAARLYDIHREDGFDLLLVGGQSDNVDGLVGELHSDLAQRLAGTFTVDTHTVTPAVVEEMCRQLVQEHEAREQAELVDRLIDAAKSGGLAALGLAEVLDAVNQRAVATMVVDTDATIPGTRCGSCNWLADAASERCPACGEPAVPVPDLVDAMAAAVRRAGGEARHIFTETPLAAHRVGASLRYAVAAPA